MGWAQRFRSRMDARLRPTLRAAGRAVTTILAVAIAASLSGAGGVRAADPGTDFSDWAVVVVAGDWRGHDGGETQAFDNTRRDVSTALVKAGFNPANMLQYSLRPIKPGDDPKIVTTPTEVVGGFERLANQTHSGCLFYVTSHGSPEGAVFGPVNTLRPIALRKILDALCPGRPTVAIVSACFSGVFVPELAAANRMVMTAARDDRSSFGCSDKDRYPYFDACILESLPSATDFLVLSRKARECVNRRETEQHLQPSSEPQTFIGADAKLWLPFMRFAGH
jgi:hypothetical protein